MCGGSGVGESGGRRWWMGRGEAAGEAGAPRATHASVQGTAGRSAWRGGRSLDPDGVDDLIDGLAELGVFLEEGLDLVDGVEDGGVVLAAEAAADVGERVAGELAAEV